MVHVLFSNHQYCTHNAPVNACPTLGGPGMWGKLKAMLRCWPHPH